MSMFTENLPSAQSRPRRSPSLRGRRSPRAARASVEDYSFSFEGPFGRFDQNQLQRGLQVFTPRFCMSCHGLQYVPAQDGSRTRAARA